MGHIGDCALSAFGNTLPNCTTFISWTAFLGRFCYTYSINAKLSRGNVITSPFLSLCSMRTQMLNGCCLATNVIWSPNDKSLRKRLKRYARLCTRYHFVPQTPGFFISYLETPYRNSHLTNTTLWRLIAFFFIVFSFFLFANSQSTLNCVIRSPLPLCDLNFYILDLRYLFFLSGSFIFLWVLYLLKVLPMFSGIVL